MKSIVAKEPGLAVYTEEYEKPVPAADEVLIKIYRNGICATDMEILSGAANFMNDGSTTYPVRFGHEFSGIVEAVGEKVTKVKPGDHVVGAGAISCGTCKNCLEGNYNKCATVRGLGTIRTWPGSFAEYITLPERHTIPLPEGISHDMAALLEPAAIGMAGVVKAKIVPGVTTVLVTGVGAIGIASAAFAKHFGAKKVIISGRTPYKLEIARKMGVDVIVNPKTENLVDVVMKETDGKGVDAIIECAGNTAVLDDCIDCLAIHGTFVGIAFYGRKYKFDMDKFILKNGKFDASLYHDYENAIKAVSEGVDISPLLTRHISFEDCPGFMMKQLTDRTDDIKVVVDVCNE